MASSLDKTALSMVNYGGVLVLHFCDLTLHEYYQQALKVYVKVFDNEHSKVISLKKKILDLS